MSTHEHNKITIRGKTFQTETRDGKEYIGRPISETRDKYERAYREARKQIEQMYQEIKSLRDALRDANCIIDRIESQQSDSVKP